MPLFESSQPNPAGHRDVQVGDVKLPPEGFRIIDVREPHEFTGELGHIPGATLVPLSAVLAKASEWNKEEPLLMVCRSGGRSANAAQVLTRLGFKAMNMLGGMLAWNAAGRSIER